MLTLSKLTTSFSYHPFRIKKTKKKKKSKIQEPNDIDQIYRVLKQAGQISSNKANDKSTANNGTTTSTSVQQQEIPTLNVPECPERTLRRGQLKPQGQSAQVKTCLTTPTIADVSSSGLVY